MPKSYERGSDHFDDRSLGSSSDIERGVAMHVLKVLVEMVGDPAAMTVDLWQLHRVILVMRGIVLEADQKLSTDADFERVAAALAGQIAEESKQARDFRRKNGIGLMDIVLKIDNGIH